MQKMKKFTSILLCWLVCAGCMMGGVSANNISDWAMEEYQTANANALVPFSIYPLDQTANITREEFCDVAMQLYYRLGGVIPYTESVKPFTDTDNANVLSAKALGIVNGTSETEFAPDNSITRQEMAKILVGVLKCGGIDTSVTQREIVTLLDGYTDKYQVAGWAGDQIAYLLKEGLMNGTGNSTLSPDGNTTREQAVILSRRCFEKFNEYAVPATIREITTPADGDVIKKQDLTVKIEKGSSMANIIMVRPEDGKTIYQTGTTLDTVIISAECFEEGEQHLLFSYASIDGFMAFGKPITFTVGGELEAPTISTSASPAAILSAEERQNLIFADSDLSTEELADAQQVTLTVPVWRIEGETKVESTATLTVHQAIANEVEAIFQDIFNGPEQFPIKDLGAYSWREPMGSGRLSEHNFGTAIDINANENYCVYADGTTVGSYWKPGEDPYSITEDGDVVKAFRARGWGWGGKDWSSPNDYMHFSYMGT